MILQTFFRIYVSGLYGSEFVQEEFDQSAHEGQVYVEVQFEDRLESRLQGSQPQDAVHSVVVLLFRLRVVLEDICQNPQLGGLAE